VAGGGFLIHLAASAAVAALTRPAAVAAGTCEKSRPLNEMLALWDKVRIFFESEFYSVGGPTGPAKETS